MNDIPIVVKTSDFPDPECIREEHGKGYVYWNKEGRPGVIRCMECGRENYAPAVSSGSCAFCGWQARYLKV